MSPSSNEYDPFEHADVLGLQIEHQSLRTDMGLYIPGSDLILLRPRMKAVVERCVLAHEIQHHLAHDRRTTGIYSLRQERRADLGAARKLIRPERMREVSAWSSDPHEWAIDLRVTGDILLAYLNGAKVPA